MTAIASAPVRYAWRRMVLTLFVGMIVLAIASFGSFLFAGGYKVLGASIERTFFPHTVGPYEIVSVRLNPNRSISIRFSARILRICELTGSQWYQLDDDDSREAVRVVVTGLPKFRPKGRNISPVNTFPGPGRYILHIDKDCGFDWNSWVEMGPFDLR